MESTSTHPHVEAAVDAAPACPRCHGRMLLRADAGRSTAPVLSWRCSRAPACAGRQRVRSADTIRPTAADASVQAVFAWERAREQADTLRRPGLVGGLIGMREAVVRYLGRALAADQDFPAPAALPQSRLTALIEHGFIVLDDRRLSIERAWADHVVIGPTGIFVVELKRAGGQLAIADEQLFVDGRQRPNSADEVTHAAAAVDRALAHELKSVGVSVRPLLCFSDATPAWFTGRIGGVVVTNGRTLTRALREGQQTLGPETVVRLALAADRLLE
ncbi:MAG TPA: nuclease-related domain-containing protein [Candidatus Limnocylindria bacterium]|nr:nuclease-related domain-containing protein [Candidatus Limnocylindria bacterium]